MAPEDLKRQRPLMTAQPLLNIHLGGTLAHTYRIAAGLGKFHSLRPIRNETAFHDTTIHIENHQASAKLSLIFFYAKKTAHVAVRRSYLQAPFLNII